MAISSAVKRSDFKSAQVDRANGKTIVDKKHDEVGSDTFTFYHPHPVRLTLKIERAVGHIRIVENARLADGTRNHKWPIKGPSFTEFESLTVFTP